MREIDLSGVKVLKLQEESVNDNILQSIESLSLDERDAEEEVSKQGSRRPSAKGEVSRHPSSRNKT